MVASREHQRFLLPPAFALPSYHCAEQDYINAELLDSFRAGTVKVRLIDQRFNWMNWMDIGFQRAPADAFLHWAGSQDRCKRPSQMHEWAARFPWP